MVGARKIQALGHDPHTNITIIDNTRIPLFQDFMFRGNMQNNQLIEEINPHTAKLNSC